jgi:hypothetical protein
MERVLKSPEPARRWPWIVAALGGAGVWLLWRLGRVAARTPDAPTAERQELEISD